MSNTLFLVIFFILWIGPVIPGVLIAKKKNRSPHWFWLSIWPGVGIWVLIIMSILKPLRKCTNCGKTIPNESKVCPFCTKEIESNEIMDNKENKKKTIFTVFIVMVIILAFSSIISFSVISAFTNSEPYKYSIELIQSNENAVNLLGENFKRKGMISGSISTNGDATGKAQMSFKVKGKNGISRVYIDAYKENGIWNYNKLVLYKEKDNSEYIDLLEK